MPSVRIKRADYAELGDQVTVPSEPSTFSRSLGNVFPSLQIRPNSSGGEPANIPVTQPQGRSRRATVTAVSPTDSLRPPSPIVRRPRAGSRVADHVMKRPSMPGLRNQKSASSLIRHESRQSTQGRRSPVVIEGSQADVVVEGEGTGEPGILGSALSLPHSDLFDTEEEHHHDDIVEHLDVIDPQVGTVSNLTNAANSILIPPFSIYSRKPVVYLTSPTRSDLAEDAEKGERPHEDALDRHVEDILARPSKIRRTLRGVWSFLKTPMGIITGIYGFLVVFWGAAIVFFLAKFINFHNANTQGLWVEISSQVTNGLFTVTGIGLIPVRALDTYRIYKIWAYKRRTRKLRAKAGLPQLYDVDDLPDPAYDPNYVHVLNDKEQADLHKQQERFRQSQTWYRPHGTETHRAFPINTALLICLFIDGNSFFQIILCGTMWGLNRFQRPAYSTGILIPASFLCGIASAIFIWRGGQKTKRTKEVEERLRLALAADQAELDHPKIKPAIGQESVGEDERVSYGSNLEKPAPPNVTAQETAADTMNSPVVDERMMIPSTLKEAR